MPKRPRMNRRIDAPHIRFYDWLLTSPAYLSLSCPARAVLIESLRGSTKATTMASLAYPFVGLPSDATLHAVPHSAPLLNSKNAASLNLQPREPLAAKSLTRANGV